MFWWGSCRCSHMRYWIAGRMFCPIYFRCLTLLFFTVNYLRLCCCFEYEYEFHNFLIRFKKTYKNDTAEYRKRLEVFEVSWLTTVTLAWVLKSRVRIVSSLESTHWLSLITTVTMSVDLGSRKMKWRWLGWGLVRIIRFTFSGLNTVFDRSVLR